MREKILSDLMQAMKNQDKESLPVIRSIKSAIQMEEINLKRNLNDDEVIGVIAKQVKTRKESIIEFEKGNREDLVSKTQQEIEILNRYLPEPLKEEEVNKILDEAFEEVNPTSMKDMGKIMSYVNPLIKGRFDMSELSLMIKERLNKA